MTRTYLLHGLRVRSEVPIDAPTAETPEVDIAIKWGRRREVADVPPAGDVLASLEFPAGSSSVVFDGFRYTLRAHGLCDFDVDRELKRVSVHLSPDAEDEFAALLTSNLLAFLLALRGQCVLHASAVESANGAVAFVAGSGMGKTTVAALCCASGAELLTDDVLRVETANSQAWCYRGSLELRLREQALEVAQRFNGGVRRSTVDQRTAARPRASTSERLTLAAVVAPICAHGAKELEVVRLRGMDAVLELVRYPRTLGWVHPEPARRDFQVLTRVAELVPVYRARLPWGPPFQRDLGKRLLARLV